jgi:hypothetical protein
LAWRQGTSRDGISRPPRRPATVSGTTPTRTERPVRLGAHWHAGLTPAHPRNTTTVSLRATRVAEKDTRLLRGVALHTGGQDPPGVPLRPPQSGGEPLVRPAREAGLRASEDRSLGALGTRGEGGSACRHPSYPPSRLPLPLRPRHPSRRFPEATGATPLAEAESCGRVRLQRVRRSQ